MPQILMISEKYVLIIGSFRTIINLNIGRYISIKLWQALHAALII